jgi:Holliday junction resolvase
MNKETRVQREIMVALSEAGCLVIRQQSGTFYGRDGQAVRIGFPGLPDLLAVNPKGEAVFIEVKPDHKAFRRPEQIKFIEQMQQRGFRAGFCCSVDEALEVALK